MTVRWVGASGWEYELQSASDLESWQTEGTWTGTGGLIDLSVFEALPGGGNPPQAGPNIPRYTFRVTAYNDGTSLISWIGGEGQPYQVYVPIGFHTESIAPLFSYQMADANDHPIYRLLLISDGVEYHSSFSALTVSALPPVEQSHFALLSDAASGIIAQAAANPPSGTGQVGSLVLNTVDAHYFRLTTRRLDSDGDGIWNDLETTTNPYDADTDNDGVTDPWSLLNRTEPLIAEFSASNQGVVADGQGDFNDWFEIFNPTPNVINLTGWHCSDDEDNLDDWAFPTGTTIAPGETLLIFASDKDPTIPELAGEFHADFKLGTTGESLFLSKPDPQNPGELLEVDAHRDFQLTRTNAAAGWGIDRDAGVIPAPRPRTGCASSPSLRPER
ncbi:MAG: lamin tail domain-containing protein [Akkermansiaceae bacterium]|nr:lamin tail domain-containing protein [Akkermansiaceae bacterium]